MKRVSIIVALLCFAATAGATTIAYDGFDFATGTLNNKGSASDPGWGGSWNASGAWVVDGSLTYGPLMVSGNRFTNIDPQGGANGSPNPKRSYDATEFIPDGGEVWMSYLVNVVDVAPSTNGTWFGVQQQGNTKLWFGNNAGQSGAPTWGLEDPRPTNSTVEITPGTHFVVQQVVYDGTTPVKWMWVDPDFSTLGGANLNQADAILQNMRGNSGNRLSGAFFAVEDRWSLEVDEYRIGNTFADVSPVIPEPLTVAGLILGGGGLAGYLRRRRRV